jgi:NADH-quinone oxidoreductase subunit C
MFGIEFDGHPQLIKLYLPEGFLGHPLRKSFPLLSREVKPWPGKVDVEGMPGQEDEDEPSTENPEA